MASMYFYKRRHRTSPTIQMRRHDGSTTQLSITFRNGEMHINPDRMDKGTYELTIDHGLKVESRQITIG